MPEHLAHATEGLFAGVYDRRAERSERQKLGISGTRRAALLRRLPNGEKRPRGTSPPEGGRGVGVVPRPPEGGRGEGFAPAPTPGGVVALSTAKW